MNHKKQVRFGSFRIAVRAGMLLLLAVCLLALSSCGLLELDVGGGGRNPSATTAPVTTVRDPSLYQPLTFDQYLTPEIPKEAGTYVYATQVAAPSVVSISTEAIVYSPYDGSYIESGAGSGVVCHVDSEKGITYIITNNHVVEGYSSISVYKNGSATEYPAEVVGTDWQTDIAVLCVGSADFKAATFGNSQQLLVGQEVAAIGNPLGLLGGTMTDGRVSALDRQIEVGGVPMTLIQHSAAVSPGNSGGGLFNLYGQCVGIVNAKSTGTGVEGLGYAIPIDLALARAGQIIAQGYVSGTPYLGIAYASSSSGVAVSSYLYNSELESTSQTALQNGDILYSLNDVQIAKVEDVRKVLSRCEIGDTVSGVFYRSSGYGRYVKITVNLIVHEYIPAGQASPPTGSGDLG